TERVLNNAAVEEILRIEKEKGDELNIMDIAEQVGGVYPRIMKEGDMEIGAFSCGMVAGLIHDVPTCEELISGMVKEAESILKGRVAAMFAA
ncbi:MAG: nitronate monooxygenase, partial [Alphaproteobacteria bacterium]